MTWLKQTVDNPLFPDLAWSRPERRDQAGKLLIIGGNLHGFSASAEAFAHAGSAGIGTSRVVLPASLRNTVGTLFPEAEFGSTTPSGSFARAALGELLDLAAWSDGVLLAGDLGRNSETALLVESFLNKYTGQVMLVKDSVQFFLASPKAITSRPDTCLTLTMAELQKLVTHLHEPYAISQSMDMLQLVEALEKFTINHTCYIITKHHNQVFVAANGRVSTTSVEQTLDPWRTATAARAAVWWLQHSTQPFEALTASILDL